MASRDLRVLVPDFQPIARAIFTRASLELGPGITCFPVCTLRAREEQAELYALGRTKPGRYYHRPGGALPNGKPCLACAPGAMGHPVTRARPGSTYHEYGRAFDVALLYYGKITVEVDEAADAAWQAFGRIVDEEGACWGGHWRSPDGPHVELHPAGLGCRDAGRLAT